MIGLVILSILIKEELRMHIDLLMGIVIAFLIVLGLMIAFSLNFIDLITNVFIYNLIIIVLLVCIGSTNWK